MKHLVSIFCGMLFGLGLAASGMTNTATVIAFLDVSGHWKIDLLLVMLSALSVSGIGFYYITQRKRPIFAKQFYPPASTIIDRKLVGGALLFGIGWGLVGYCPGPVVAALYYGQSETVIFLVAMLAGMFLVDALEKRIKKEP